MLSASHSVDTHFTLLSPEGYGDVLAIFWSLLMSKPREMQCVGSFLNLLYVMIYLINSGKMAKVFSAQGI
jgi:hypothetical protein